MKGSIFKLDKKGEGYVLYFWMFLIFIIIGISIAISLAVFFSGTADVRINEAETLANKLITISSDNGHLNKEILKGDFNYFEAMSLNPKMFTYPGKFYFNLTIFKDGVIQKSIIAGDKDFEVTCELPGKGYPKCIRKNLILSDKSDENKKYDVRILAGSNQLGESL